MGTELRPTRLGRGAEALRRALPIRGAVGIKVGTPIPRNLFPNRSGVPSSRVIWSSNAPIFWSLFLHLGSISVVRVARYVGPGRDPRSDGHNPEWVQGGAPTPPASQGSHTSDM